MIVTEITTPSPVDKAPEKYEPKFHATSSVCGICQQPFATRAMMLPGLKSPIVPKICDPCAVLVEKRQADGLRKVKAEREAAEAKLREEAWTKLCPWEFRLTTESGGNTKLYQLELEQPKLKQVLSWKYGPRGLIVKGSVTGQCKTRCVWRLLRREFINGRRIVFMTAAQFDSECKAAAGKFMQVEWMNRLAECDILFLDDLGKAPWTDFVESNGFELIDRRGREGKPIIITTNHDRLSLGAKLSTERAEPLIRRLADYSDLTLNFDA